MSTAKITHILLTDLLSSFYKILGLRKTDRGILVTIPEAGILTQGPEAVVEALTPVQQMLLHDLLAHFQSFLLSLNTCQEEEIQAAASLVLNSPEMQARINTLAHDTVGALFPTKEKPSKTKKTSQPAPKTKAVKTSPKSTESMPQLKSVEDISSEILILLKEKPMKRVEIEKALGASKATVQRSLVILRQAEKVVLEGKDQNVVYCLV